MDETTQQNSALVEENAATAKTLENQARSMDQRVASFRLRAGPTGGYPTDGGEAADGDAPRMEAQGSAAIARPGRQTASGVGRPLTRTRCGICRACGQGIGFGDGSQGPPPSLYGRVTVARS